MHAFKNRITLFSRHLRIKFTFRLKKRKKNSHSQIGIIVLQSSKHFVILIKNIMLPNYSFYSEQCCRYVWFRYILMQKIEFIA